MMIRLFVGFCSIMLSTIVIHSSCGVKKEVYYARKFQARSEPSEKSTKDPNRAAAYASKPKYVYEARKEKKPVTVPKSKERKASSNKPSTASSTSNYFKVPLSINRSKFVNHAMTYRGIPYVYGGIDPKKGLDCSGFVYNVFQHFGVQPPRTTQGYMNIGKTISVKKVEKGDILLFTGRDNVPGEVGHMGIVVETHPQLKFIHSASGKNIGVIVSEFKGYYVEHFIKAISLLQ